MRRAVAVLVAVLVTLGIAAPQAYAQAAAAPPAPKVTINGLVDFVTTLYKNWSGGSGALGNDVTDSRDDGWYSRERGVFTITGEIGKSKGVLALEIDITNGQFDLTASGVTGVSRPTNVSGGGAGFPGTSASADLDTDVAGIAEVKWLYVETPVTGQGSLLPFLPMASIGRFGAQPARGHNYKPGILFSGDFPGVTLETTWAPNLRSTLTFAQIREALDNTLARVANVNARESWAFLASFEVDVFKGLTVKPTYAYAVYDGGNTGTSNLGTYGIDNFTTNGTQLSTVRHTIGAEARWSSGPFSLQPSFFYQWGDQEISRTDEVDISAWILDVIGGFRSGPLTVEGRVMWTSGMDATDRISAGKDIHVYMPINAGFSYMAGWSEIWTSGIVDYATALLAGIPGMSLRTAPSYDKYGRVFVGLAADYALTPALTFRGIANWSWTEEDVDTDGSLTTNGINATTGGDESFLGTEVGLGLTYRFAPNVAFDLMGAYLFTGDALGHDGRDPHDVYKISSRVRVTW